MENNMPEEIWVWTPDNKEGIIGWDIEQQPDTVKYTRTPDAIKKAEL